MKRTFTGNAGELTPHNIGGMVTELSDNTWVKALKAVVPIIGMEQCRMEEKAPLFGWAAIVQTRPRVYCEIITKNGIAITRDLEYNGLKVLGGTTMDLISAREASDKWGISPRRVAALCTEGKIAQAMLVGNTWVMPADTEKPEDNRSVGYTKCDGKAIKPFLKWAGGKGQLLKEIEKYYPFGGNIEKYAEPFVGGGAVLFDILSRFEVKEVYISDVNAELINTYRIIRYEIDKLIELLSIYQLEYIPLDASSRKDYYIKKRERFNDLKVNENDLGNIEKAALMIFLNKTCFNGLYRVNKKGLFNVPMGAYKTPLICDDDNLRSVSEKLQTVTIVCGDYRQSADFIDERTFVYFDPPYRPITDTANFTAYTEALFGDQEQIELARFVEEMHRKGAKIVVSNSDPKNSNTEDDFFDTIYASHNIRRVEATRMINCNSDTRGRIKELLISNY